MAGYRISLEIDNRPLFDRVFKRMDLVLSDLTPVWVYVRNTVWDFVKDQFQTEGRVGASGRWKPLSEKYLEQKVRKYGTFAFLAGVLIATEAMYKAYTRKTSDSVVEIDKQGITLGAKGEVGKRAARHQRGGRRLPQRKIYDFSAAQKKELMKGIQKEMLKEMKKQGIT